MKTRTRIQQHQKSIVDKKWDLTGISSHAKSCRVGFNWEETTLLKTEERKFDRKVREALEIQLQQTSPHSDHGLNQQHQQEEIEFLIKNFTDNGYKKNELVKIANEFRRKRDNPQHSQSEDNDPKQIVVLPWVPGLSPKLRKSFRNAGYKVVFKSSTNLKTLLTSRNKSKLPHLSQPGVYMTTCG